MHTYTNPWFKPGGHDPETYRCESAPVQIGRYQRFYRIKDSNPGRRCYDYVFNGVCFTQRCGACDEAQIDADKYAQDSLKRFFGVTFGPTWDDVDVLDSRIEKAA